MFVYCGNNPAVCIDSTGAAAYVIVGGANLRLYTLDFVIELGYKVLYTVDNQENYEVEVDTLSDGVSISMAHRKCPIDLAFGISPEGKIEVTVKNPMDISDKVSVASGMNGNSLFVEVSIEGENEMLHCISLSITLRKKDTSRLKKQHLNVPWARKVVKAVAVGVGIVGGALLVSRLLTSGSSAKRHHQTA